MPPEDQRGRRQRHSKRSSEASQNTDQQALGRVRVRLDPDGVPAALRDVPHWVAWVDTLATRTGGRFGKVPIAPHTGHKASTTDAATWSSFGAARKRAADDDLAGVGFVFTESEFVGVDLDHCRDAETGAIEPWALSIVEKLATYTEVSPSGTGLHSICRGKLPKSGRRKGPIEMYDTGRFFTITGVRVPNTLAEVADRQTEIEQLHRDDFSTTQPRAERHKNSPNGVPADIADDEILARARAAKNGAKFNALWSGDITGYPSQSEAELALVAMLAFWTGPDPNRLDALFRRSGLMRDKWAELRGGSTYGRNTIDAALAGAHEFYEWPSESSGSPRAASTALPTIIVVPGRLPEVASEAEAILAQRTRPLIYQRERELVRVIRTEAFGNSDGIERPQGSALIIPVELAYLVDQLTRVAEWVRRSTRGKPKRIDAPDKVARTVLARAGEWRVPSLLAVIEAPTIRADGSVLDRPGYDAKSGLLFDAAGTTFPAMPTAPSREDAVRALERFEPVLKGFPFRTRCDRAVAIAAILTSLVRRSIRTAPLTGISAPTMSSGKSLYADVVSMIATGRCASVTTQGKDEAEDRKRILAILVAADPVVVIDNVDRPLEGADLCAVLTQESYQGRLLGLTKMAKVPTCTTWIVTGNNLVIRGDLASRTILCELDARCEAPQKRKFDIDLRQYVPEHRGELIVAALTIVLAYINAGCPELGLPVFGRFEDWSRMVRAPLVWIGESDPVETMSRVAEVDPARAELRALLHAWHDVYRSGAQFVADVVRAVSTSPDSPLADAIASVAAAAEIRYDARELGRFLAKHQNRIEGGLRFERAGEAHGKARWRVVKVGGGSGGSPTPSREKKCRETDESREASACEIDREPAAEIHPIHPNPAPNDREGPQ